MIGCHGDVSSRELALALVAFVADQRLIASWLVNWFLFSDQQALARRSCVWDEFGVSTTRLESLDRSITAMCAGRWIVDLRLSCLFENIETTAADEWIETCLARAGLSQSSLTFDGVEQVRLISAAFVVKVVVTRANTGQARIELIIFISGSHEVGHIYVIWILEAILIVHRHVRII